MAGISGSRRARSSLLVLVPLAVALGACGGTSGGGGGTKSEVDAGGTGSDAGDAGSSALGFTPSNIGAALAGVDLTKLEDVSWTLKFKPEGLYSDSDTTTRVAKQRGGVVFVEVPQPNGTKVGVYIAKSWRIEEGSLLAVNGKQPMALVAIDTITVLGGLRADADGFDLGAGGFSTDVTTSGMKGGGPGGGAPATASGSTGGAGSGGGAFCGAGGTGGASGAAVPSGGAPYGLATVIPLQGGSAAGSGNFPGAGGGALQLVAGKGITIGASGVVTANGGHGGEAGAVIYQGGGGGGAGGAVLLESPTVVVQGALTANGGGGGVYLQSGANGAPDANPATGGGAAAATIAGANGSPGDGSHAPGGGGGGTGWIRINTQSGAATLSGIVSPSRTTSCVTEGKL